MTNKQQIKQTNGQTNHKENKQPTIQTQTNKQIKQQTNQTKRTNIQTNKQLTN